MSQLSSNQPDNQSQEPGVQSHRYWSPEEEKQLLATVSQFGTKNWKHIASFFVSRTASQCAQRYRRLITPSIRKPWTAQEDAYLKCKVGKNGKTSWAAVARGLPGRTGKQVRERYLQILNPNVKKTKFSNLDDQKIIQFVQKVGFKWKYIAKNFQGRSDNQIKNRFYSHIFKKIIQKSPEKYSIIFDMLNQRKFEGTCDIKIEDCNSIKQENLSQQKKVPKFKSIKKSVYKKNKLEEEKLKKAKNEVEKDKKEEPKDSVYNPQQFIQINPNVQNIQFIQNFSSIQNLCSHPNGLLNNVVKDSSLEPFYSSLQRTEQKLQDKFEKISMLQAQLNQKASEFIANASCIQNDILQFNQMLQRQNQLLTPEYGQNYLPNQQRNLQNFQSMVHQSYFSNQGMTNEYEYNNNNNFNNIAENQRYYQMFYNGLPRQQQVYSQNIAPDLMDPNSLPHPGIVEHLPFPEHPDNQEINQGSNTSETGELSD